MLECHLPMEFSRQRLVRVAVVVLALITLFTTGPAADQTAGNYVIGPQDVLAIVVLEDTTLNGRFTVEADGEFTFPLIGRIKAGGLTTREFESSLKKRLAAGFFKDPQVTVAVETYRSQRVFVTGEVRNPGMLSLTGGMTLAEALARVGSTTPGAAGEIAIIRLKKAEPIRISIREMESGNSSQNVELQDGDQVYVLRAESIYVFGEVRSPGAYAVQPGMTVLQALSLAGGLTPNAAKNRMKIVRMVGGKRVEVKVKESDLVRQGDTIIVPERFF